ncbi:MAG: argininosuccinate lyase, partial [Actinobacteria bacterium]|nr:argininosuccinate lyase [Actinomycetota bacterium]
SRLLGDLAGLAALSIGLPLGYHRDFQEDKEPVFDAAYTLMTVLPAVVGCLETATFDPEAMRAAADDEDLFATDLAEALVRAGVPFRDAHRRTGELLRNLGDSDRGLRDMTAQEWAEFGVAEGASMLDPDVSVRARATRGGPSPEQVRAQADLIESRLASRE